MLQNIAKRNSLVQLPDGVHSDWVSALDSLMRLDNFLPIFFTYVCLAV